MSEQQRREVLRKRLAELRQRKEQLAAEVAASVLVANPSASAPKQVSDEFGTQDDLHGQGSGASEPETMVDQEGRLQADAAKKKAEEEARLAAEREAEEKAAAEAKEQEEARLLAAEAAKKKAAEVAKRKAAEVGALEEDANADVMSKPISEMDASDIQELLEMNRSLVKENAELKVRLNEMDGKLNMILGILNENADLTVEEQYAKEVSSALRSGKKLILKNILFDYNKARLRGSSELELDKLAAFLIANPDIDITVSGHTDAKGDAGYGCQSPCQQGGFRIPTESGRLWADKAYCKE